MFHDFFEIEKAQKLAEQFSSEATVEDVATQFETKIVQEKEGVQEYGTKDIPDNAKGKEALIIETEKESSNSSGSHMSEFDEDPKKAVQKILVELKNSRKKHDVVDTEYVPMPDATLGSSHSLEDVPLKSKVGELRKKKKKDGSGMKRKEGIVLRSRKKAEINRPRKNLATQPKPSTKKTSTPSGNRKKSPVPNTEKFVNVNCVNKWKVINKRGVIAKRIINEFAFD